MPTEIESKNILASASFQGLAVAVVSVLLERFGVTADAGAVVNALLTAAGALWALYGIIRRPDIRVLPQ